MSIKYGSKWSYVDGEIFTIGMSYANEKGVVKYFVTREGSIQSLYLSEEYIRFYYKEIK